MTDVQAHIEQLNAQLNEANARLQASGQEISLLQQRSAHADLLQQELNEMRAQLQHRTEQVHELQLASPELELERMQSEITALRQQISEREDLSQVDMNNEFSKGRVPDLIKGLPIFNGNPKQVSQWIQSVDRILDLYKHLQNSSLYPLWLQEIRNKITGEAGDLLCSNGTSLNWAEIKQQLNILYGDKRELSTLLQKLFSLKQARSSVGEFYSQIQDCFTGISTQIQMNAEWTVPTELVRFVDKICLEKFIDGLEEPYSSHTGLLQPKNLNQAFQYAMEKANKEARRTGEYDVNNRPKQIASKPPPIPIRNPQILQTRNNFPSYSKNMQIPYMQQRPFPNQINQFSLPRFSQSQSNQFFQPRTQPNMFPTPFQNQNQSRAMPFGTFARQNFPQQNNQFRMNNTKPQPVEKMDVDPSIRVNYMNRPKQSPQHFMNFNSQQWEFDPYEEYQYFYNNDGNENFEEADNCPTNETSNNTPDTEQKESCPKEDDLNFHLSQNHNPET